MLLLLIAITVIFQSALGAQVCTAVQYSGTVYETDGLWNPTNTIFSYNFNLSVTSNYGNYSYPNVLTITQFNYSSSDGSTYYLVSPMEFNLPNNQTYYCPWNSDCNFITSNGITPSVLNLTIDNMESDSLLVIDITKLSVVNGAIYDGRNGNTLNQTTCLIGKSDTIHSQRYFRYNQTACCIQYSNVDDSTPSPSTSPPTTDVIGSSCSTNQSLAWLDIAFVFDISNAESTGDLDDISAEVATILQYFTLGQNTDHTTRAGIITYATNVKTLYQLRDATNNDDFYDMLFTLSSYSNPDDSGGNITGGLQEAWDLLKSQKTYRRPVIVLTSAAYNGEGFRDADKLARKIQKDGITIIVINYSGDGGEIADALRNISSSGYYYLSSQTGVIDSVSFALTQINCYCPSETLQLSIYNPQWLNSTKYADCLNGAAGDTAPLFANRACRAKKGALVALTSQAKMDFITDNIITTQSFQGKKKITIGLHKSSAGDGKTWKWWGYNGAELPYGSYPPMQQAPAADDNYGYMWNHYGFNWTLVTGHNVPLPYICEERACDASNLCK